MYWKYMNEQVGHCACCIIQSDTVGYIAHEKNKGIEAALLKNYRRWETKWNSGLCGTTPLETCSLRAAALLCGKRKCISNSEQFLLSRLQLANLQAAWIMHRHLAVSCRPCCFLPQWTDIPHWRRAAGGVNPDALITAMLRASPVLGNHLPVFFPSCWEESDMFN